jgi:hypothetical protein
MVCAHAVQYACLLLTLYMALKCAKQKHYYCRKKPAMVLVDGFVWTYVAEWA